MDNTRDERLHKGDWVTNNPKSIKSYWPRRAVELKEGRAVLNCPWQDFEAVGVYLDQDIVAPLKFYPLCRNLDEYETQLRLLQDDPSQLKIIQGAWLLECSVRARVEDWAAQSRLEDLFASDEDLRIIDDQMDLHDIIDDLTVSAPSADQPIEAAPYLEYAQQLWDDSRTDEPAQS